jgi:hypothetical protein
MDVGSEVSVAALLSFVGVEGVILVWPSRGIH